MLGRSRHACPSLSETCVPRKEQIPGPAIAAQQIPSKRLACDSEEPLSQLDWAPLCARPWAGYQWCQNKEGQALPSQCAVTKEKQMCDQPTKRNADVPLELTAVVFVWRVRIQQEVQEEREAWDHRGDGE